MRRRNCWRQARCKWRSPTKELFRDIVILMRDTRMRNERELFRMRIENLDWDNRLIFVADSKTLEGRRLVPMSRRVFEILHQRCETKNGGWVFPSSRSKSGHLRSICKLFRKARIEAGLPKELVLYCARHDYGTRILTRTGNLAAVMKTMVHRDVKTAMHYQHPELEIVLRSTTVRQWIRLKREVRRKGLLAHSTSHPKTITL
jgi:integrase